MTVNTGVTPLLNISASSTTICSGTLVNFTATPSNGIHASYQWKLNANDDVLQCSAYSSKQF
ncbi:MAG: hypothetical protein R2831_04715 [Chitinophagaceae bacterium]